MTENIFFNSVRVKLTLGASSYVHYHTFVAHMRPNHRSWVRSSEL